MFSYTVLAGQEEDSHIAAKLEMLDESIRAAEFCQEPGVAGPFYP